MLKIEQVDFSPKKSKKKILDNISFSVKRGDFVAIMGTNGSGKSTLSKVIMGILPTTKGKIVFKGENISKLSVTERARRGISLAFQQPVRFKGLTVSELLDVASSSTNFSEISRDILEKVGLSSTEYLEREVDSSLSGGEMKRIEIATIIARNSDFLIFDEPEAGIDIWSFNNLVNIFKKLSSENKTILVISHQERILKLANKILVLQDGKIKEFAKSEKILPKILGEKNGV